MKGAGGSLLSHSGNGNAHLFAILCYCSPSCVEAIGMKQAQDVIRDNHVQTYWDNNVYQNVGSFELGNATFQIWLEDNQSIAEKVKLIPKYGLAGVASWKLGFEDSSIWATITENLQG